MTHRRQTGTVLLLMVAVSGCGYTFGPQPVRGVRTVHVPVVQTDSFRRNLDYLLTEAVQAEIRTRTVYRLEEEHVADTILNLKIVDYRKDLLSETRFDDARELQLTLGAQISWIDRRNGRVLQERIFPISQDLAQRATDVSFAPELGHSMATAQQKAAERMAAQIVDIMELPW
ncbi:MAG: LPS assembly lipoprotein LptE [Fuerstiella sp.]|nr:LPS assembly lipoprotein LptE [Fuerstiella sp.]